MFAAAITYGRIFFDMECPELRKDFPFYVRHQLSEEKVQILEEHLCVCQECRDFLSNLLDHKELLNEPLPQQPAPQEITAAKPEAPSGSPMSSAFSYILIAAAVLMILALGFLMLQSQKFTAQ